MRNLTVSLAFLLASLLLGCGPAGNERSSGDETGGTDVTSDTSDSTDATGDNGTDGGTDSTTGDTGVEIPDCQFAPPIGAQCNPYPGCPGTGCSGDEICTLTYQGGLKKIECDAPGDVPPGGPCDYEAGQRCVEGLCVENQCRSFCNDNPDCPNNAACIQMSGQPKPTICGAAQTECDPIANDCAVGLACYLLNTGLTDCLVTQASGGQGNACEGPDTCAPGFVCTTVEGQQVCGAVCLKGEGGACADCPPETTTKSLTDIYGACVPAGEVEPPPDPIPCDILAQDCEGAAQACYPTNQGDQCLQKGNKPAGSDCQNVNECAAGTYCHGSGKCLILCDPADGTNPTCETGLQAKCTPVGGSKAGFCDE